MTRDAVEPTAPRRGRGRPRTVRPEAATPSASDHNFAAIGDAVATMDDNADPGDERPMNEPANAAQSTQLEEADAPNVATSNGGPLFIVAITNHSPRSLHLRACGLFIGGGSTGKSSPVDQSGVDHIAAALAAELMRQGVKPDRVITEISGTPE